MIPSQLALVKWLAITAIALTLIHRGLVGTMPFGLADPTNPFQQSSTGKCVPAPTSEPLTVVGIGHGAGEAVRVASQASPEDVAATVQETFELLGVAAGAFRQGALGEPIPTSARRWEAEAVSAAYPAPCTPAPVSGTVQASTPPVTPGTRPGGWGGHSNGQIPPAAMCTLPGHLNHRARCDAAEAFGRMDAAMLADLGQSIGVTDSYRTYASQVRLAQVKGLYSRGGLAARPGTSNHGWGLALDLDLDAAQQAWIRANGGRFGYVEDTPREKWHWGYYGTAPAG